MSRRSTRGRPVARPPQPNFPEHDLPDPYARLLTLGTEPAPEDYDAIAADLKAGDVRAAAAKLTEMVLDTSFYQYYDEKAGASNDDPRPFTPWNALGVLMRLDEAAQSAIEPLLPLLNSEDDWLREEIPVFYAAMGRPAIEPLARLLLDPDAETFARVGAGESLQEMAEANPELQAEVVPLLEQALVTAGEDETLAGFVICSLLDVGAKESLPIIQQAFEEDRVDPMVVEMADVEEHFDLPRTTPRRGWKHLIEEDEEPFDIGLTEESSEGNGVSGDRGNESREAATPYVAPAKVGRNDPCPCGSGKKYKKCCGQ